MEKLLNKTTAVIFCTVLSLWRMFVNATVELHPDEAYYWLWSKHLSLSYYDHPPMIAYAIKLTTLVSASEFWVRLSGVIVSIAMSVLIWILAKELFKSVKIAAGSVMLLNAYPLTMSGSIIITPDVPAFLFWSYGIFAVWQAVRSGKAAWWYVFGAMFGLSLLSKYTAVLLFPCALLFLAMNEERGWLRRVHPYLSAAVAGVIFLPVIAWNAQHQWISFRFQMSHGLSGFELLGGLAEYIGGQLLVITPFAWLAGMWAVLAYFFHRLPSRK